LAEPAEAARLVPLRQPLSLAVHQQLAVVPGRRWNPKGAHQQNLPGCGAEQIRSADDLRDLHCGVIHDHSELVSRHVIPPPEKEVAKIFSGYETLRTEVAVHELDCLSIRHTEPPIRARGRLVQNLQTRFHGRKRSTSSGIDSLIVVWLLRCPSEILSGAVAGIDATGAKKPLPSFQIEASPPALRVRPEVPSYVRPFPPSNAEPGEILKDRFCELGAGTVRIEILVAQNQDPSGCFSSLKGDPKRSRMAEMQESGRRGCDSTAIEHFS
jgi:hypothetical protein